MTPEEKALIQVVLKRVELGEPMPHAVYLAAETLFRCYPNYPSMEADDWIGAGAVSCVACRGAGCDQCSNVGMWREPDQPIALEPRHRPARECIAEHAPGEQTCEWCCDNCAPLACNASSTRADGTDGIGRDCAHGQEWLPATFALCLAGDRIRLSGQETVVRDTRMAQWHARNREWTDDAGKTRDHQTRWDHTELLMDLEANPGMHEYPAATECEILCDTDRRAALELQRAFSGTKPVDK